MSAPAATPAVIDALGRFCRAESLPRSVATLDASLTAQREVRDLLGPDDARTVLANALTRTPSRPVRGPVRRLLTGVTA